jgi:hypothetical protein
MVKKLTPFDEAAQKTENNAQMGIVMSVVFDA